MWHGQVHRGPGAPPTRQASDIAVWEDETVSVLIDSHPDELRAIPELAVSLDMREGELFDLAEEDLDLDGEKIVRVRRQVRKIGQSFAFAFLKNDRIMLAFRGTQKGVIVMARQPIDRPNDRMLSVRKSLPTWAFVIGAGDGNRTCAISLGSYRLHPEHAP
jgi:hypothetical protein